MAQYLLIHPLAADDVTPDDVETSICELASDWGNRDPLAASRWVATLPEGSARVWAAKNLAARWAEYEPAAARLWVSTLPVGDRFEVVDYLDSGAAWKE
ncbi:hypothetical protein OKA05_06065 [Luteolibacter arcticus]|uniref:Uncharacterized protein n=1 Tax=Luteolibacter arcticus TaxID=1581411 RepID=A0ABT3GET0_9BACT|nr:hypothetical protein [Luteolibacter arcticus]MCW1922110.1 hypothetical protein [Luteolibacter arcticus]